MSKRIFRILLVSVICVLSFGLLTGCSSDDAATQNSGQVSIGRKPGIPKTEEPAVTEEAQTVDVSELYIVQLLNTKKEKIFLKNLYTGREYVYRYSLTPDFFRNFRKSFTSFSVVTLRLLSKSTG